MIWLSGCRAMPGALAMVEVSSVEVIAVLTEAAMVDRASRGGGAD